MSKENRPRVGLGVIVRKDGKVLMGKRKNAHGEGTWCFPGGHLEFGESWEECARREVREEVGVEVRELSLAHVTNDIFSEEDKHYITLFLVGDWVSGEVMLCEPDKNEQWGWFPWEALPQPLFIPVCHLLESGYHPFLDTK